MKIPQASPTEEKRMIQKRVRRSASSTWSAERPPAGSGASGSSLRVVSRASTSELLAPPPSLPGRAQGDRLEVDRDRDGLAEVLVDPDVDLVDRRVRDEDDVERLHVDRDP